MAEQGTQRAPEGSLCDHCHDPKRPLTEADSAHIVPWYVRDSKGREIAAANVHKECAEAWIKANEGRTLFKLGDAKSGAR